MFRHFLCVLFLLLPVSRFFRLKRYLLKYANVVTSKGVKINGHTWFYGRGEIVIGENTWIGPSCQFYSAPSGGIVIGKNCDVAPEVSFVTGTHEVGDMHRRAGRGFCQPIVVEDGCWIGARVTILGGVTVGKGSIIGSGALVTEDVPANSLAVGVPAKVKKCLN